MGSSIIFYPHSVYTYCRIVCTLTQDIEGEKERKNERERKEGSNFGRRSALDSVSRTTEARKEAGAKRKAPSTSQKTLFGPPALLLKVMVVLSKSVLYTSSTLSFSLWIYTQKLRESRVSHSPQQHYSPPPTTTTTA